MNKRFRISTSLDKQIKKSRIKVVDSWDEYGTSVTFFLSYPYTGKEFKENINKSIEMLKEDYKGGATYVNIKSK